jgi:peroxiredoxin
MRTLRIAAGMFLLLGTVVLAEVARNAPPPAGDGVAAARAADFSLRGLDGEAVSLEQFRGKKPVLLVFWATWCPECKAAIPKINALHGAPEGERLEILALDYRETREKVAAAVQSRDIRYRVLLDDRGEAARAFGVVGIPTYILVGRDGNILYRENVLSREILRYL